jgi:hypothetical protein
MKRLSPRCSSNPKPATRGLFLFQEITMADYYSPTIVQPSIPLTDISPLEQILLEGMFETELDDGKLYLFSNDGPSDQPVLPAPLLRKAFVASVGFESQIAAIIGEALDKTDLDAENIDLDLTCESREFILQDIVRRSATLGSITVETSFMCSRMRPDGFGGCATFITAETITGISTKDFLEHSLGQTPPKSAGATFHIDEANSNAEYLHVDIPSRHATLILKAEQEGVVVDIYPLGAKGEPAATAAVLSADLRPTPPLPGSKEEVGIAEDGR